MVCRKTFKKLVRHWSPVLKMKGLVKHRFVALLLNHVMSFSSSKLRYGV